MPLNNSIGKDALIALEVTEGSVNDGWYAYLGSLGYTGSLNDRWFKFLGVEGHTGTIDDRFHQLGSGSGAGDTLENFETEITLDSFALGPSSALPIFTGRGALNSGWVPVSGSGEPDALIQGRMVGGAGNSAWVAVVDAAGDPVTCDTGDGSFSGFIAGGQRSLTSYTAQVRYTEAGNTPAETANSCYIGRVLAIWSQSDHRWLGLTSAVTAGTPSQVATTDNLVRFVTLDRDPDGLVGSDTGDLLVFDIAGTSPTNREPMWAMGNALMELFPNERIVVACHVVSGSSDKDVVNDDATHESGNPRIWEDEVIIAEAAQPHLTEITSPVAYDLAVWAWSTGAAYTGSSFVDAVGPQFIPFESDGTPITRDAEITVGGQTFDANHFWSDIYDFERTKVAFREQYDPAVIAGQEMFEDHAVYGDFVTGFPVSFSRTSIERGRDNAGTWTDITHGSIAVREGQVRDAEIVAAHMAYVLGVFDPGTFSFDYIYWPEDEEDDERYVYIGIVGKDVTTMRDLNSISGTGAFGEVTHFTINGSITEDAVLATFDGQQRIRLEKPSEAAWTGVDVIGILDTGDGTLAADVGYEPTNADYLTRYTLDAPVVEVDVDGLQALPVTTRVSETFFDNPLPLPASASMVWLDDYTNATDIGTTPSTILSVTSDGSPILIFIGSRSASTNATLGFPDTITLGGVDISSNLVEDGGFSRTKGSVYYVPSPATGSLDLALSFVSGQDSIETVAQVFNVTGGGGVGASPVVATGSSAVADSSTDTASEDNVRIVQAVFSTLEVVSVTDTTWLPAAEGGVVSQFPSSNGISLSIANKVVSSGQGGGTFGWDGVTTVARVVISFELLPA